MEIIREACTRTVLKTSRPSLSYADGILTSWHEADVRTIEDIHRLDDAHTKKREDTKNDPPSKRNPQAEASIILSSGVTITTNWKKETVEP